jgi:hypothetical protein
MTTSTDPCFACGRHLGKNPLRVDTRDGQTVFVGRECVKHVLAAGDAGWQPPRGGPRLFPLPADRLEQKE